MRGAAGGAGAERAAACRDGRSVAARLLPRGTGAPWSGGRSGEKAEYFIVTNSLIAPVGIFEGISALENWLREDWAPTVASEPRLHLEDTLEGAKLRFRMERTESDRAVLFF